MPCIEAFGPGILKNGSYLVDQFKICLEDGKLVQNFEGQIALPCGCKDCCGYCKCNLCLFPTTGLTVDVIPRKQGIGLSSGRYTINYLGGNSCAWYLSCLPGPDTYITIGDFFLVILSSSFSCLQFSLALIGVGSCLDPEAVCGGSSQSFNFVDINCYPLSIHFESNSNAACAIFDPSQPRGSIYDIYITDPNPPSHPYSNCCATLCLNWACGGISGATVTILKNGETIATGITSDTGCVVLDIGTSGIYTIVVTADDFQDYSGQINLKCCETTSITIVPSFPLPPGQKGVDWTCCGDVAIPYLMTLTDIYGSYSFAGSDQITGPVWYTPPFGLPGPSAIAPVGGVVNVVQGVGPPVPCSIDPGNTPYHYIGFCTKLANGQPAFVVQRVWGVSSCEPPFNLVPNDCVEIFAYQSSTSELTCGLNQSSLTLPIPFAPFNWSGSLIQNPGVLLADPVGGIVAIS